MSGDRARLIPQNRYSRQNNETNEPVTLDGLKIVLVGTTSAGKSATGNTIVGRRAFESKRSSESVTKFCSEEQFDYRGKTITIIDTPGVHDTNDNADKIETELRKMMLVPGPRIFLLVISLNRAFTAEGMNAVNWIYEYFGELAFKNTIILFTYLDCLEDVSLQDYVSCGRLMQLVKMCDGRYHGFNNKETNNTQVENLMMKTESMLEANNEKGICYSEASFMMAKKEKDKGKKIEKAKNIGLKVATGVGATTAVAGGIALGLAEAVILPAVFLAGGGMVAAGACVGDIVNHIKKKDQQRNNPYRTRTNYFGDTP